MADIQFGGARVIAAEIDVAAGRVEARRRTTRGRETGQSARRQFDRADASARGWKGVSITIRGENNGSVIHIDWDGLRDVPGSKVNDRDASLIADRCKQAVGTYRDAEWYGV